MTTWRCIRLGLVTLVLAAVAHVAIVLAIPVAITSVFMSRIERLTGVNHVTAGQLPTDKSRGVVSPSPDLLYAVCIYDTGAGPVHVSIAPPQGYWSLSLFARNTDNFFKLGAADVKSDRAELILVQAADAGAAKARFPAATVVATPGTRGVLLARILVLDQSHMEAERAAQKSVTCVPTTKGS